MQPLSISSRVSGRGLFAAVTVLSAVSLSLGSASPLLAQASKKKEAQMVSGKVTAIEKKGKVTEWTIEVEGGDPLKITFTAKSPQLKITGKADSGFLRPGTVISAAANREGNNLAFKDYTVHLGNVPAARMVRDRNSPVESYEICAQIVAVDGEDLLLNVGGGRQTARLEQGSEASLESTDPSMVPEGSQISLEGFTKSGKFVPIKVIVNLDKVLSGEEYFAALNAPKTKASAKSKDKDGDSPKTTKSKTSKTKDDPAAGAFDPSDPFGLKKKPAAKKNEKKEEKKE